MDEEGEKEEGEEEEGRRKRRRRKEQFKIYKEIRPRRTFLF